MRPVAFEGSADTTAMYHPLLAFISSANAGPAAVPQQAVTLPKPTSTPPQIQCLLPLPDFQPPLLLTGSADEHVRVYDLSLGEGPDQARLLREVEGHCAEVVAIRRWIRSVEGGKREEWVVSAGLDGTIRKWKIGEIVLPPARPVEDVSEKKKGLESGMTEEELRELEELMSDDD